MNRYSAYLPAVMFAMFTMIWIISLAFGTPDALIVLWPFLFVPFSLQSQNTAWLRNRLLTVETELAELRKSETIGSYLAAKRALESTSQAN
jgi:hypothetical protein